MTDRSPTSDMISFRLDGVLAEELDRVAAQDGLSRSALLRGLLVGRVEERPKVRCIRQLWTIHGQLQKIAVELEDQEEDATQLVQDAVNSVGVSLEWLGEEFEDEDD